MAYKNHMCHRLMKTEWYAALFVTRAENGEMELHTYEVEDVWRCLHAPEDAVAADAKVNPMAMNRRARKL